MEAGSPEPEADLLLNIRVVGEFAKTTEQGAKTREQGKCSVAAITRWSGEARALSGRSFVCKICFGVAHGLGLQGTGQVQRCGYNALERGVRSPKRTFFCMPSCFLEFAQTSYPFSLDQAAQDNKNVDFFVHVHAQWGYACRQAPEKKT